MRRLLLAVAIAASGCAHSEIVPFSAPKDGKVARFASVLPENVGIYRSTIPFPKFTEVGMISYRATSPNLVIYYDQIRKDAAEYGAHAVVGVKFTSESHVETVQEERCSEPVSCEAGQICQKECTWVPVLKEVTTYLCTGSMIREEK